MGCYAIPTSSAIGHAPARFGGAVQAERERSERHTRHGAKPREATGQRPQGAPSPLLETSTTRNILHQPGAPCYTDSVAEHLYRARVADFVERNGWQQRANAMRVCGLAAIQVDCKACGSPHLVPFRCGSRTCPTCARSAAAAVVDRIVQKVQLHDAAMLTTPWEGAERWSKDVHYRRGESTTPPRNWRDRRWKMVTITRWHDAADAFNLATLREHVRESRRLFSAWWRRTPWGRQVRDRETGKKRSRRDTSYVVGLEVAPGGMVHFHVAIYGEYVQQRELLAAWRTVLQKAGLAVHDRDGGVNIQALRKGTSEFDALREVLKYATKGQTDADGVERMPEPWHAAAVECAFRSVRRSDVGGALRRITSDDICDLQPDDLHNCKVSACEGCGVIGEWEWRGMRSRQLVERNGGFGLHRIDALGGDWGDAYRPPPDRGFC